MEDRNDMGRKLIGLLSLICISSTVGAKAENDHRLSGSFAGGLYITGQPAWMLEPSIDWHINRFFGIGAAVEVTRQYNQPSRTAMIDGREAELVETDLNVGWMIFKPYVLLSSPTIWKNKGDYMHLWIQARPGISLACPFSNSLTYELKEFKGNLSWPVDYRKFQNKGLQWFYWNASVSLNLSIGRWILAGGYGISNLDYYSCRRNVALPGGKKFPVPDKELSQSVFISLGYIFR